jgi:hypothetical protein
MAKKQAWERDEPDETPTPSPQAAVTFTQLQARRDVLMAAASRVTVILNKPDAVTDTTVDTYLVKDPDPGDAPVTTTIVQGNAKGGDVGGARYSWKGYTYSNLGTAYSLP